jgi:excisionase family DNA binding protein
MHLRSKLLTSMSFFSLFALRGPEGRTMRREEPRVEQLLSPAELSRRLGIGRTTTYALLRTGQIASIKVGRLRRVRPRDVEEFLERNRAGIGE